MSAIAGKIIFFILVRTFLYADATIGTVFFAMNKMTIMAVPVDTAVYKLKILFISDV